MDNNNTAATNIMPLESTSWLYATDSNTTCWAWIIISMVISGVFTYRAMKPSDSCHSLLYATIAIFNISMASQGLLSKYLAVNTLLRRWTLVILQDFAAVALNSSIIYILLSWWKVLRNVETFTENSPSITMSWLKWTVIIGSLHDLGYLLYWGTSVWSYEGFRTYEHIVAVAVGVILIMPVAIASSRVQTILTAARDRMMTRHVHFENTNAVLNEAQCNRLMRRVGTTKFLSWWIICFLATRGVLVMTSLLALSSSDNSLSSLNKCERALEVIFMLGLVKILSENKTESSSPTERKPLLSQQNKV